MMTAISRSCQFHVRCLAAYFWYDIV